MNKNEFVYKDREGRKPIQVFAPTDVKHDFKMACVKANKPMKEILLNMICDFIKENK